MISRFYIGFISVVLVGMLFGFSSCDDMEDNYEQYLEEIIYSPRVTNLSAVNSFKTVTLSWDNPQSNIAQKIIIRYDEEEILYNEMVNTAIVKNLEVKGYEMSVYTLDADGNYSVPALIYVFPNGEE